VPPPRRQPLIDRVVIVYSALGTRGLLWIVASAAVGSATGHWRAIPVVAAVVWLTLGLNFVVKRVVRRERPSHRRGRAPLIVPPASPSFPSSHAAMAGAGAVALSLYATAWWPLFATLAVLMAASRVYLAVHHVSDVVAGLVVGAGAGAAFALLAG
jgi:membrane-associated phospholipid phosphatase